MFEFMSPAMPTPSFEFTDNVAEMERLRARHRHLLRNQKQHLTTRPKVEALDMDEGRTRKISAKWRRKQQLKNQQDDGNWPMSAGTEMHVGFNAFDFSASPEAFYDEMPMLSKSESENACEQKQTERLVEVARQVTPMGLNSASVWEQQCPGRIIHQLPTFNQGPMWGAHYATHEGQC